MNLSSISFGCQLVPSEFFGFEQNNADAVVPLALDLRALDVVIQLRHMKCMLRGISLYDKFERASFPVEQQPELRIKLCILYIGEA